MPIVRKEVSDRSPLGKLVLWAFILFNPLMFCLMVWSCSSVGEGIKNADSEFEAAGSVVDGAVLGGTLFFIWLAGAMILGLIVLLTRRTKVIEVEEP